MSHGSYRYNYETFGAESKEFDERFTHYLNAKGDDHWRVKHCNFCHGAENGNSYASCLFERKH